MVHCSRRAVALLLFVVACEPAPKPPPFSPAADVRQLMATIIEPAAEVYWDAVAAALTPAGQDAVMGQPRNSVGQPGVPEA